MVHLAMQQEKNAPSAPEYQETSQQPPQSYADLYSQQPPPNYSQTQVYPQPTGMYQPQQTAYQPQPTAYQTQGHVYQTQGHVYEPQPSVYSQPIQTNVYPPPSNPDPEGQAYRPEYEKGNNGNLAYQQVNVMSYTGQSQTRDGMDCGTYLLLLWLCPCALFCKLGEMSTSQRGIFICTFVCVLTFVPMIIVFTVVFSQIDNGFDDDFTFDDNTTT